MHPYCKLCSLGGLKLQSEPFSSRGEWRCLVLCSFGGRTYIANSSENGILSNTGCTLHVALRQPHRTFQRPILIYTSLSINAPTPSMLGPFAWRLPAFFAVAAWHLPVNYRIISRILPHAFVSIFESLLLSSRSTGTACMQPLLTGSFRTFFSHCLRINLFSRSMLGPDQCLDPLHGAF